MTCRDCQLELHRDHKYDFVADRIEETKKEVYNFFKKIEYVLCFSFIGYTYDINNSGSLLYYSPVFISHR